MEKKKIPQPPKRPIPQKPVIQKPPVRPVPQKPVIQKQEEVKEVVEEIKTCSFYGTHTWCSI